ncbi:hypothetical protein BpHYR1_045245 [Brachionus plicatilis]|uniref:Uncharacterized protein n=1 Tax=Brachionus plicatilis TaxID=10195 RepID=A0A3M7SGD0_BRAPC|nr:hypothetical protein BpHYR1_045245 [Brachionus plicatilis]
MKGCFRRSLALVVRRLFLSKLNTSDAQRPNVSFVIIGHFFVGLTGDYFRGHPVRCSDKRIPSLNKRTIFGRYTKIGKFDLAIFGQQYVASFHVPVNNKTVFVGVKSNEAVANWTLKVGLRFSCVVKPKLYTLTAEHVSLKNCIDIFFNFRCIFNYSGKSTLKKQSYLNSPIYKFQIFPKKIYSTNNLKDTKLNLMGNVLMLIAPKEIDLNFPLLLKTYIFLVFKEN